jgi:hypothetical protein
MHAAARSTGYRGPVGSAVAEVDELVAAVAPLEDHRCGVGRRAQRWVLQPTVLVALSDPDRDRPLADGSEAIVAIEDETEMGRELGGVPGRLLDDARHATALYALERRGQRRPAVPAQHQWRHDMKRGSLFDLHLNDVVAIRVLNEQLHPADPPLNPILSIAAQGPKVQPTISDTGHLTTLVRVTKMSRSLSGVVT